ncbi:uncharacterized protein LOC130653180 [Hydractinia symbiolongicarpus]|uniref:uncharacterized protein LOC130653180 n=1 Tax=Hydractinia symbiolongicarpus TaxID=13093 RepID=UPI00254E5FC5|nr:uncharacterized protein LOC130653180 [Hydractinia symbiolongicarpus]
MKSLEKRKHESVFPKIMIFCLSFLLFLLISFSTKGLYIHEEHSVQFVKVLNIQSQIQRNLKNRKIVLLIGIFTASKYKNRRDDIRDTWMKTCHEYKGCKSLFILDGLTADGKPLDKIIMQLQNESSHNNNDMKILRTPLGRNFALRILESLRFAFQEYDFDYFLRVDDDYYPCIHRLMFELPKRMNLEYLFWGFTRCSPARIDEGFVVFNNKLAIRILEDENSLICTDFGTTSISKWVMDISRTQNVSWFADNERVWHHPPVSLVPELKKKLRFVIRILLCMEFILAI